jgi:hypothetical protein
VQKDVCGLEPVYTTGFGFLEISKPTLPELTPETKGTAEVDRHSAAREHRNGDRGAWMGRVKRHAKICPLPGASPGVQDKLFGTRRDGVEWLCKPLQAHQQSSEQHNHLALIRPTAIERLLNLGYSVSGFLGVGPTSGAIGHCRQGPSVCKSCRGWHRPSGLAQWWWTKLLLSGIHFHLNQPLTANCQ